MSDGAWVFGYGSLASPASLERTLKRPVPTATGWSPAHLDGFGRRWNYGSQRLRGDWHHAGVDIRSGVVVSLGLVATDESCNGAMAWVSAAELELLDHRESDYLRTDVTDRIRVEGAAVDGPIVTYVPRPSAVARYEAARDDGRAAVRREYWHLVHAAFGELGDEHLRRLQATPPPDVPVVDVTLVRPGPA